MGTCFFLADLQLLLLSNRGKGSYYYLSALSNKRGKLSEVEYPSLSKISFSFAYGYGKNINDTTLLYVVNLSSKGVGLEGPQNLCQRSLRMSPKRWETRCNSSGDRDKCDQNR